MMVWSEIMLDKRREPSFKIAAAVSSQEVSIPKTNIYQYPIPA